MNICGECHRVPSECICVGRRTPTEPLTSNPLVDRLREISDSDPWMKIYQGVLRGAANEIECLTAELAIARATSMGPIQHYVDRLRDAAKYAETVMKIVEPRSDKAEYLLALKGLTEALAGAADETDVCRVCGKPADSAGLFQCRCTGETDEQREPCTDWHVCRYCLTAIDARPSKNGEVAR